MRGRRKREESEAITGSQDTLQQIKFLSVSWLEYSYIMECNRTPKLGRGSTNTKATGHMDSLDPKCGRKP